MLVAALTLTAGVALAPAAGPDGDKASAKSKVRYSGTAKNGQPISFRVVTKAGKSRIKGLAVDVVTECWADLNDDGLEDNVVAHITKLHGKVSRQGLVEVYYAPDDDTEYVVEGKIVGKVAKLNVIVGGRFSPEGIPNAGNLDCDNWGTRYKAKQRG